MYSKYPGMGGGLTKSSGARADKLLAALKSRIAKLPRDEKALALAGMAVPIPGSVVALPAAWRAVKSMGKHGIPGSSRRDLSKAIEGLEMAKVSGISKEVLASMRDELEKIATSKIAADYTSKVVGSSGSSDIGSAIGKVFSGNPPSPSMGQGGSGPSAPQKFTASPSIKASNPKNPKSPKNPKNPMGAPKQQAASGSPGGKPGNPITGGGMPFVAQPLAGVSAMPSMAVPPPPLPIIR